MSGGANAPGGEGVAERRDGGVNDALWSATSTEDVAGDFVTPFPGGGDDADHHPFVSCQPAWHSGPIFRRVWAHRARRRKP